MCVCVHDGDFSSIVTLLSVYNNHAKQTIFISSLLLGFHILHLQPIFIYIVAIFINGFI